MSTWRDDLGVLRHPRVRRLIIARTISVFGSAFAPVALAFGVLHLPHGDEGLLSIVLACESIPMVVFMLFGGVIADRFARDKVLIAGELSAMTAFGSIAAMMLLGWTPTWALGAAAAFSGIAIAIVFPALTGVIPQVVPKEHLQAGNALLALGANIARVAGLVLSGMVVALVGASWSLVVTAGLFGSAALVLAGLKLGSARRSGEQLSATSVLGDLKAGWSEFTKHEWLWVIVAQWSIMVMFLQGVHAVLGPVLADAELGGARGWSYVLAGEAAGMLLGVLIAMRFKPRRPILWAAGVIIPFVPLPYLLMGLTAPLWTIVLAAFAMGLAFDLFGVLWQTTMQRVVPPEALSRVSSYDALGSLMLAPVGLMLAGPFAQWLGIHHAMLVCAAALLIIAALPLLSRDVRTLRWHEPADEQAEPHLPVTAEVLP